MSRLIRQILVLVLALILMSVAHRLLNPAPIPAITALFGGLIALWFTSSVGVGRIASGAGIGLAPGVLYHLYVHDQGLSPVPSEGVPAHLAMDALLSFAVAALILLVATILDRRLSRTHPPPDTP